MWICKCFMFSFYVDGLKTVLLGLPCGVLFVCNRISSFNIWYSVLRNIFLF